MLIITRKSGESIRIGDQITITVLDVKGKKARIGIEAPADMAVHREEVYYLIQEQNVMAAECAALDGNTNLFDIWNTMQEQKGEGE